MVLEEGKEYRVVANKSHHEFPIGEIVRLVDKWDENSGIFEYLDGSDNWAASIKEVEEV